MLTFAIASRTKYKGIPRGLTASTDVEPIKPKVEVSFGASAIPIEAGRKILVAAVHTQLEFCLQNRLK